MTKLQISPGLHRLCLAIEWFGLFVLVPIVLALAPSPVAMRFGLMGIFFYVIILTLRDRTFELKGVWLGFVTNRSFKILLLLFSINAPLIVGCTALLKPERFFLLPIERPLTWLLIMILYPFLSVLPQEMIYRMFFFRRYQTLFPTPLYLMAMSALSFSFMHIIFHNVIAPSFCLLGGLIFSMSYQRTRSLYFVFLEHALYGCFIFTCGLGPYFLLSHHLSHL